MVTVAKHIKISDLLVEFLIHNGVDTVFGIVGAANSHIFDSIHNSSEIRLITVHHEQAAAMAMGAYYRTTGKLSASIVTAGAGSSNAFTGVLSNWADSIPGLIISGQEQSYYMRDHSHRRMQGVQGYKSTDVYKSCTKLSDTVTSDNVYHILPYAFHLMLDGRPGPVFLEIPFDTQSALVDCEPILSYDNDVVPHDINLTKLLSLISMSERPVLLGGHGIKLSNSVGKFQKFVDTTQIPTVLSWSAIDVLDAKHSCNFGTSGICGNRSANMIVQNSDLLIVMGSRLSIQQTGYALSEFAPYATVVHIDIDPSETDKFGGLNINESVGDVLDILLTNCSEKVPTDEWLDYCISISTRYPKLMPEHIADPTSSYTFIDQFSKKLQDNYVIVTDMGTALLSGFYGFNVKKNQTMFTSLGLGEMGYGISAAVGASCGNRPVMCLNCDGGMMMNLQELQTIKSNNLPVKIVIFNNDGYLMIKHTQRLLFNGHMAGSDPTSGLTLPDYKKVASAFDYEYFTDMDAFLNYSGHAILEVFMDSNQEFIPKVRGKLNSNNTLTPGKLHDMYPYVEDGEFLKDWA